MAFGKKKGAEAAPAAEAPETPDDGIEVSDSLFAAEPAEEEDRVAAGVPAEEKAEAAKDPFAGDLLNMFQTTQIDTDDLTVLLDLAGDVELDDLLEDLQTIAAAMGCNLEHVEEYAAA